MAAPAWRIKWFVEEINLFFVNKLIIKNFFGVLLFTLLFLQQINACLPCIQPLYSPRRLFILTFSQTALKVSSTNRSHCIASPDTVLAGPRPNSLQTLCCQTFHPFTVVDLQAELLSAAAKLAYSGTMWCPVYQTIRLRGSHCFHSSEGCGRQKRAPTERRGISDPFGLTVDNVQLVRHGSIQKIMANGDFLQFGD